MVELDSKDMEQFAEFHSGGEMEARKSTWDKFKAWNKLLVLLLVLAALSAAVAIFFLITPAIDFIFRQLGLFIEGWERLSQWLFAGDRGLAIAGVFGLLSILFLLLARFRYSRDRSVYVNVGCPQCHEHELLRIRRWRRDRILEFFGVPARRYACRNCTWQGTRLVGYSSTRTAVSLEGEGQDIWADLVQDQDIEESVMKAGAIGIAEEPLQEGL